MKKTINTGKEITEARKAIATTGPAVADTGADLHSFESADARSDAKHTRGPRSFKGSRLAEYSSAVSMLWHNVTSLDDKTKFMAASLIYLLMRLQAHRETAQVSSDNLELIWESAYYDLLLETDKAHAFRVKIVMFVSKLSKDELGEAVDLALAILNEADEERPEPEPVGPIDPSTSSALSSQSGN